MIDINIKHTEIVAFCKANSSQAIIQKYSRYFKEGYDSYGIDKDIFYSQINKWVDEWGNEMTLNEFIILGDKLISTGKYEEAGFAMRLLLSKKDEFSIETFNLTGKWLENGIQNWGNTDALCMSVLSLFVFNKIVEPNDFIPWTKSASKWKRRAVPVTFVEAIKKGYEAEPILVVIEKLMEDDELDVQKGIGTLLREIWKKQPELSESFMMVWKDRCGRKIIQYATEKMDKSYRTRFKKVKK
jgi:3-methyladenine DNA glycosylase AlkD